MEIRFQPIRIAEIAEREADRLKKEGWHDVRLWKYGKFAFGITAVDPISECKVLFDRDLKVHYYWRSLYGF